MGAHLPVATVARVTSVCGLGRGPEEYMAFMIEHLAKLSCMHVEIFELSPILGWWEWCSKCQDFNTVIDGVSMGAAGERRSLP